MIKKTGIDAKHGFISTQFLACNKLLVTSLSWDTKITGQKTLQKPYNQY